MKIILKINILQSYIFFIANRKTLFCSYKFKFTIWGDLIRFWLVNMMMSYLKKIWNCIRTLVVTFLTRMKIPEESSFFQIHNNLKFLLLSIDECKTQSVDQSLYFINFFPKHMNTFL